MKLFLSWSGSRSKKVAENFRELLRFVFHDIDIWMSSEDIAKGKRWSPEIAQALEDANAGVICLTKENLNRPWLLFEAGALSKILKDSLVCTFLLDVEQADIGNDNPLSQFQSTKNSKEDVFVLFKTINQAYGDEKLDDEILEPTFEKWWPDFERKISSIPPSPKKDSELPVRKESEILSEILETVRNIERKSGTTVRMVDVSGNIVASNPPIKGVLPLTPLNKVPPQNESGSQGKRTITKSDLEHLLKMAKKINIPIKNQDDTS